MKVFVLDDYQNVVTRLEALRKLDGLDVELSVLNTHIGDESELIERLRDVECLVLIRERTTITERIIDALPQLKLIVQTGRLAGCIDLPACERRGIKVCEGSGSPVAPAELTWALVLAASRRIVPYAGNLERGVWQRTASDLGDETLGTVLNGRTLGIWGLGRIGARVAAYGRAFGMNVVVHGREQSQEAAQKAGYEYIADRSAFMGAIDVLSVHLKMNSGTKHMITVEDLSKMREGSLFVNTSRAELVAPGALLAAMEKGRPTYAALDVFESEPEGVKPYLEHPRILCTPHVGFVERSTYELYFDTAFNQVREFVLNSKNSSC